jgi:hypothetical protein
MAPATGYGKPELSTMPESGTFYFALTPDTRRPLLNQQECANQLLHRAAGHSEVVCAGRCSHLAGTILRALDRTLVALVLSAQQNGRRVVRINR